MRPAVMLLAFLLVAHTSLTGLAAREEISREGSQLQTTPATSSQATGTGGQLKSVDVKIPAGTSVEIETAFDTSSALWGFKKGKHAVIPAGKRFVTFVNTDVVVSVPEIRRD